jgi:stage II sporulation protein D
VAQQDAASVRLFGTFELSAGPESTRVTGPIDIKADHETLAIIASMDMETYVSAVLAGEAGGFRNSEALKAMAVAVRTYATHFQGRHAAEGFDLCDSTHCQDLRLSGVNQRMRDAAEATQGELVWFEGATAATYYHADCGGTTETGSVLQHSAQVKYLPTQPDPFCLRNGGRTWKSELTKDELLGALQRAGVSRQKSLRDITVIQRTPSGRVARVRLIGEPTIEVAAVPFRLAVGRTLGWTKLRSDLYQVSATSEAFVFSGRGAGHGVGLCQSGADAMAAEGHDYRAILTKYYPGTVIGLTAAGLRWERITNGSMALQTAQPDVDRALLMDAQKALRSAEDKIGWQLADNVTLKVFPSVAAYLDATGEPGWMAASTRGRVIRLQPAEALRRMAAPQKILEHELLHLLVESKARPGTPLWFREGLVLALSGEVGPAQERWSEVQLENSLTNPTSEQQLRAAYREAGARVQKLIRTSGKAAVLDWLVKGLPTTTAR